MSRVSHETESVFSELATDRSRQWLGENIVRILEAVREFHGVVLSGELALDMCERFMSALEAADAAVAGSAARQHISAAVNEAERHSRADRLMQNACYPIKSHRRAQSVPQELLLSLAAACARAADEGWTFPRFFPRRRARLWDWPHVARHFESAFYELQREPDTERRGAGALLLLESVADVFGDESDPRSRDDLVSREGDLVKHLRPRVASIVAELATEIADAEVPREMRLAWNERLLTLLRTTWPRVFVGLERALEGQAEQGDVRALLEEVTAAPLGVPRSQRSACFALAERCALPSVMAKNLPERDAAARARGDADVRWLAELRVVAAFEAAERTEEALAFLRGATPGHERQVRVRELLIRLGHVSEALSGAHIEPHNVHELAAELGLPVGVVVEAGIAQAKDKSPWLAKAISAGAFEQAESLAGSTFHPRELPTLLSSHPAVPAPLAKKLIEQALKLCFGGNTPWLPSDDPRAVLRTIVASAEDLDPSKATKVRARYVKKLEKAAGKTAAYSMREAAFDVVDELARA